MSKTLTLDDLSAAGIVLNQNETESQAAGLVEKATPPAKPVVTVMPPKPDAPLLAMRKAPHYSTKQERPAHRVFLELAAQGFSVKEIAEQTGYTPVCVNNILRQPHLQQTLVNSIRDRNTADQEVVEIIRENVVKAVELYAEVLSDKSVDMDKRLRAADALLNRRYGKPNQPINRGTDVDLNNLSDAELAKIVAESGTHTATS